MVFELNEIASQNSYNYSYYPYKIYEETTYNENYTYTFKTKGEISSKCLASKINRKYIILMPYCSYDKNIYCNSFALYPENPNPTGHIDFNLIDKVSLSIGGHIINKLI